MATSAVKNTVPQYTAVLCAVSVMQTYRSMSATTLSVSAAVRRPRFASPEAGFG